MPTLVVCWNSHIHEFRWRIGITESYHRDIDVGSFFDGLCVGAGIRDDDEAGLFEGASDIVGEVTRGKATGNSDRPGVSGELENSTLAVGAGGDDSDVSWVVYCGNNASSKDDLLPIFVASKQ